MGRRQRIFACPRRADETVSDHPRGGRQADAWHMAAGSLHRLRQLCKAPGHNRSDHGGLKSFSVEVNFTRLLMGHAVLPDFITLDKFPIFYLPGFWSLLPQIPGGKN